MRATCPHTNAYVWRSSILRSITQVRGRKQKLENEAAGKLRRSNFKLQPTRGRRYEIATPASHIDIIPALAGATGRGYHVATDAL
eukprot:5634090-Alexandrium_andersonii.AAC.1